MESMPAEWNPHWTGRLTGQSEVLGRFAFRRIELEELEPDRNAHAPAAVVRAVATIVTATAVTIPAAVARPVVTVIRRSVNAANVRGPAVAEAVPIAAAVAGVVMMMVVMAVVTAMAMPRLGRRRGAPTDSNGGGRRQREPNFAYHDCSPWRVTRLLPCPPLAGAAFKSANRPKLTRDESRHAPCQISRSAQ